MSDILQEINDALDPGAKPDAVLTALNSAKAEIITLRASNADLEKRAEAAGAASTAGPTLKDIRQMVRQEIGLEPRDGE
jgi:hypothetical protein